MSGVWCSVERMFGEQRTGEWEQGTGEWGAGGWESRWETVPEGLATMAPGPELAELLARIDRSRLNGHDLVTVMQAWARQVAHAHAEVYATMAEVALCPPGGPLSPPERLTEPEEFASVEVAAALRLTRRSADLGLDLAWTLTRRLPQVWEALHRGDIDATRARVITDAVDNVPHEVARRVADQVLERARNQTTGQLRARLRRLVIQEDPDGAQDQLDRGTEDRRVVSDANPDGTANLHALSLPPDEVAAIMSRLDHLARRAKTRHDCRTTDQTRADVLTDLLIGRTRDDGDDGADGRGVIDLTVPLTTLAGLTHTPGDIGGWGPVTADIARRIALRQQNSQWRFTVTDPDTGAVLANGTTPRRPTAAQKRHLQAHHRTCVMVGCRMPATACDIDHTRPFADGGPTHTCNGRPLCRYHHRCKDQGHWDLQPNPDHTHTWTSPLHHTYTTDPSP